MIKKIPPRVALLLFKVSTLRGIVRNMNFISFISFFLVFALLAVSCITYGWFGFMLIAVIILNTVLLTREVIGGGR